MVPRTPFVIRDRRMNRPVQTYLSRFEPVVTLPAMGFRQLANSLCRNIGDAIQSPVSMSLGSNGG
jgi:hypothetical protein